MCENAHTFIENHLFFGGTMYYERKVLDDLYLITGNDRRLHRFENMFALPEGVAYNAYLLMDEKTVLFDGMDGAVRDIYDDAVRKILNGRPLDYFVIHHVEPDHCMTIIDVLREHPETKVLCSKQALTFLKNFYPDHKDVGVDFDAITQTIAEGDTLSTGRHELLFLSASMVHWPEVMVTYDKTDRVLFSADAFGSFKAADGHNFVDKVDFWRDWLDEARRYYINIVGRQGKPVMKVLGKASTVPIDIICPIHGLVWRDAENIGKIIDKYVKWASYVPEEEGIVIIYSSMYGNGAQVAEFIAQMLSDRGVRRIKVHDVAETETSIMIADLFQYSHVVFWAQNYNTLLYPVMEALIREIKMLNWQNRKVGFVHMKSWAGKSLEIAREELGVGANNIEEVAEPVMITSSLKEEQFAELERFADQIAATFEDLAK